MVCVSFFVIIKILLLPSPAVVFFCFLARHAAKSAGRRVPCSLLLQYSEAWGQCSKKKREKETRASQNFNVGTTAEERRTSQKPLEMHVWHTYGLGCPFFVLVDIPAKRTVFLKATAIKSCTGYRGHMVVSIPVRNLGALILGGLSVTCRQTGRTYSYAKVLFKTNIFMWPLFLYLHLYFFLCGEVEVLNLCAPSKKWSRPIYDRSPNDVI